MGLIAGIGHFDFSPVTPGEAAAMCRGLESPAGEALAVRCSTSAAMVGSKVLGGNADTASLFAWDGRLDHRDALETPTGSETDDALARQAYLSNGIQGFRNLVGDWSLALWSEENRSLILARDYAGVRPLYYHVSRQKIVWSSSLSHLSSLTGLTDHDPMYAVEFLAGRLSPGVSAIAGIRRAPPGCAIRITRDSERVEQFWEAPTDRFLRYKDPLEYEQHFVKLLEEAVALRLRGSKPVCAELSGGLDSSSIVCIASRILERTSTKGRLNVLNYVADDCPDQRFRQIVERHCGLTADQLNIDAYPFASESAVGKAAPLWGEPLLAEVAARMRRSGAETLMTGRIGDLVMGNWFSGAELLSHRVSEGRWRAMLPETFEWSQAERRPVFGVAWDVLQNSRASWRHGSAGGWTASSTEDSLSRSALRQCRAGLRSYTDKSLWRAVAPGRRQRLRALLGLLESRSLECPDPLRELHYTHPFSHWPLVEFMLMIPPEIVYGPGQPRLLMRRSLSQMVPQEVLHRRSKASYKKQFRAALLPLARTLLRTPGDLRVVDHGYVDASSLTSRLARFLNGVECNESQLRNVILFEFWLRNRGSGNSTKELEGERRSPYSLPLHAMSSQGYAWK